MRRTANILFAALAGVLATAAAGAAELPERCRLVPVNGACKALIDRVYFDVGGKKCRTYFYDGCGPVVPFEEIEDCRKLCETGAALRLGQFSRVPDRPFALFDLEYPKDWTETPAFTVRFAGREVPSRTVGGGASPEANMTTLEVFMGTEPGTSIEIEAQSGAARDSVKSEFHFVPRPLLLLLGHAGNDEALLEPAKLDFLAFKTGTPAVRLDGAPQPLERVAGSTGMAELWRAAVAWKPGRNVVTVEATGADGKVIAREYSFVDLTGGELAFRQKANLAYGVPGSRSGPFYEVESSGDAVALGAPGEASIDALDSDGWPTKASLLMREIVGAAPGAAVLRIVEKPHFLQPERIVREIRLQVSGGKG